MNAGDRAEAAAIIRRHCPDVSDVEVDRLIDGYASRPNVRNLPGLVQSYAQTRALDKALAALRDSDHAEALKRAREEAERQPACHHGTPGGTALHPDTGQPWLCGLCKAEQQKDLGAHPAAVAGSAEAESVAPGKADELVRLAAVPDYPAGALCGPLADLVSSTTLPAALVGAAGLAALAGMCGLADLRMPDQSLLRPALWVVQIGARGAGKTPAMDTALGLVRELDAEAHEKYRQAVEEWQVSKNGQRPVDPTRCIDDATIESVARWLHQGDGTGLVDSDELSGWRKNMGQYKSKSGDESRWLAMWSSQPWRYQRVGNDRGGGIGFLIRRPVVSIVGGLQPHLHYLLGDEETGFRPRWLPHIAPPGSPGWSKRHHEPSVWDAAIRELYAYRERREWQLAEGRARALWERASQTWKDQARGAESAAVSAALDKADIQCARIALVIAESLHPGVGGPLPDEAMACAAAITSYVVQCWRTLPEQHAFALSNRDERLARKVDMLASWLENRRNRCATRREIQQANVAGVRSARDLDTLLSEYTQVYPGCVMPERTGRRGPAGVTVCAPPRDDAPRPIPLPLFEGDL